MVRQRRPYAPTSLPVATIGAVVILIAIVAAAIVALGISGNANAETTPWIVAVIGIVATTIPGLIAAGFAERAAKDIRNGTVTEKAKIGTVQALVETGVTTAADTTNRNEVIANEGK